MLRYFNTQKSLKPKWPKRFSFTLCKNPQFRYRRRQYCGIFEAKHNGVVYYFLDNQYYFKRDGIYGHYDDAERFAFFSRAVLEIIPHIDWKPVKFTSYSACSNT